MLKKDLIKKFSAESKLTYKVAEDVINGFFEAISRNLIHGNKVVIRNFGVFNLKKYRSYIGRNPKTQVSFPVRKKVRVAWKSSNSLVKKV